MESNFGYNDIKLSLKTQVCRQARTYIVTHLSSYRIYYIFPTQQLMYMDFFAVFFPRIKIKQDKQL